MNKLIAVLFSLMLFGCEPVPNNTHVVSTDDCGSNWIVVKSGDRYPDHRDRNRVDDCGYNLSFPKWLISGRSEFTALFQDNILSNVQLDYAYKITDPLAFIKQSSYVDSRDSLSNYIVNNMILDSASPMMKNISIVRESPLDIQQNLLLKLNESFSSKGVIIHNLTIVLKPDELTRLAIDSTSALHVFDSAGVSPTGEKFIEAQQKSLIINIEAAKEANK
jgi:hypothetical protein